MLVSEATGLYQLLRDEPGVLGSDCVIPIEVRGTDADHPHEQDIEAEAEVVWCCQGSSDAEIRAAAGEARTFEETPGWVLLRWPARGSRAAAR